MQDDGRRQIALGRLIHFTFVFLSIIVKAKNIKTTCIDTCDVQTKVY